MIIRDTELKTIEEMTARMKSIDSQIDKEENVLNPRDWNKHDRKLNKLNARKHSLWDRRALLVRAERKSTTV